MDEEEPTDLFIRINGESFRCCGCRSNVFRKLKNMPNKYTCNGCVARYSGYAAETGKPCS